MSTKVSEAGQVQRPKTAVEIEIRAVSEKSELRRWEDGREGRNTVY